ncbi:MAG: hypothetical protein L6Q76_26790 [Polyangiaceae bacterium]|nr:hypothetical protein [Polyangiaceae bacterium]
MSDLPLHELKGHADVVVRFSHRVVPLFERSGGEWLLKIPTLDLVERAPDQEEAKRRMADRIAADVNRLTRAFPSELSSDERKYRAKLLEHIDLLAGELGIDFPRDRWLLGRLRGSAFVPVQDEFAPLALVTSMQRASDPEKLWFARVATYRDGRPTGEVLELEPAPDGSAVEGEP